MKFLMISITVSNIGAAKIKSKIVKIAIWPSAAPEPFGKRKNVCENCVIMKCCSAADLLWAINLVF